MQYWFGAITVQCGWGSDTVRVRCCTDTVRYINVLLLSTVSNSSDPPFYLVCVLYVHV